MPVGTRRDDLSFMSDLGKRASARARESINKVLVSAGFQMVRTSALESFGWHRGTVNDVVCDPITLDHDRLADLRTRYRSHPAAATSLWSDAYQKSDIDLARFRADNAYLWQQRDFQADIRYVVSALYARLHDPLHLWGNLDEDGCFGAYTVEVDGQLVSRDLLDSMIELNSLEELLGISERAWRVLDIGAGYGRLAHRATAAMPNLDYVCTDGIALSTHLCERYLARRGSARASVVPLDELEDSLPVGSIDLVVNVHSFSECPLEAIRWWVDFLARKQVPRVMIVPSDSFRSQEPGGARHDYLPLFTQAGYQVIERRPKYAHSTAAQRYGVFPTEHLLLGR